MVRRVLFEASNFPLQTVDSVPIMFRRAKRDCNRAPCLFEPFTAVCRPTAKRGSL